MAEIALPLIVAGFDGHMDWDGGWGVAMLIGMIVFWGLAIAAAIWLFRELAATRRPASDTTPTPLEILDRRLAEGEITIEEYEQRRAALLKAGH